MTWQVLLNRSLSGVAPLPAVNQAIANYGQVVLLCTSTNQQPTWRSAGNYKIFTGLSNPGLPFNTVEVTRGNIPLNQALVLPPVSFSSWTLRVEPHPWLTNLQVRAWVAGPPIPPLNAYERVGKFAFWADSVAWFLSNSGYWLNLCRSDLRTIGKPGSGADLSEDWLLGIYQVLWESPLSQVSGFKSSFAYNDWVNGKRLTLPDLRNSVLISADGTLPLLSALGANTRQISLSIANLPSFTPQGTIASAGGHTHTLTVDSAGGHTHTLTVDSAGGHTHTLTVDSAGSHTHTVDVTEVTNTPTSGSTPRYRSGSANPVATSAAGAHTHTGSAAAAGAHTHTGSAAAAGAHTHTGSAAAAGAHTHTFTGTAIGENQPISVDVRSLSTVLNLFVSCGGPL